MKPMKKIINGLIDGINEDSVKDIVEKDSEIAALREALDGVRWRHEYGGFVACIECGRRKTYDEHHTPTCKIGRLFAKEESQHV